MFPMFITGNRRMSLGFINCIRDNLLGTRQSTRVLGRTDTRFKYKIGEGHLFLSGSEFSLIVPAKIGGFYVLKFGCYSVTGKRVILCVLFSTREFTVRNKECRGSAI